MDMLEAAPAIGYIASGGNGSCYNIYRRQLPPKGGGGVAGDQHTYYGTYAVPAVEYTGSGGAGALEEVGSPIQSNGSRGVVVIRFRLT